MRVLFIALLCACSTITVAADEPAPQVAAAAVAVAAKGQMLTGADGGRLGVVNRIAADGSPQIIIDGRLVTIPANTISAANGKLTTSLTKSAVLALH
jgi:hypothetical protein